MKIVHVSSLRDEEAKFLGQLSVTKEDDLGIPLFLRVGENFLFIEDFKLATSDNRKFEEGAPERLYRGGGIVILRTKYGVLALPDERYGVMKPLAAGIAQYGEADDLTMTCVRELMEEAFVYSLDHKTRFIPKRFDPEDVVTATCLGFSVEDSVRIGTMCDLGYSINNANRSYEAVLEWDISDIEVPFSVNCEEGWFGGGNSAITVFVLDENSVVVGVFSGQQGFVPFPEFRIHSTLIEHL